LKLADTGQSAFGFKVHKADIDVDELSEVLSLFDGFAHGGVKDIGRQTLVRVARRTMQFRFSPAKQPNSRQLFCHFFGCCRRAILYA
jgi:hypothetical protein